jgi:formate hydrogenlyase subunit 6/NADH:ubiquinone oxidoreductase subunit I
MLLMEFQSGLWFALKQRLLRPRRPSTTRSRRTASPRFRGAHALRRHPNGESAASPASCEAICPAQAITIEVASRRDDGTRRTTRYDIDSGGMHLLGFCQEACPVDANVEGPIRVRHRDPRGARHDTSAGLANGDRWEREIARTWRSTRLTGEGSLGYLANASTPRPAPCRASTFAGLLQWNVEGRVARL